jgi:hypothetical protein
MLNPDGPNPQFGWIRPISDPPCPQDAADEAKGFALAPRLFLPSPVDGIAAKGVELTLAPVFRRTPVWLLDALIYALAQASLPAVVLGIHYGYVTSWWHLLWKFATHFFL